MWTFSYTFFLERSTYRTLFILLNNFNLNPSWLVREGTTRNLPRRRISGFSAILHQEACADTPFCLCLPRQPRSLAAVSIRCEGASYRKRSSRQRATVGLLRETQQGTCRPMVKTCVAEEVDWRFRTQCNKLRHRMDFRMSILTCCSRGRERMRKDYARHG